MIVVPAIVFFASKLVKKYHLTIILDTSMVVTLADGSQVETDGNLLNAHNYVNYEQKTCVMYGLVQNFARFVA